MDPMLDLILLPASGIVYDGISGFALPSNRVYEASYGITQSFAKGPRLVGNYSFGLFSNSGILYCRGR